ncbi:MAG: zinc ribbon domain-containing protein [Candidatus Micrarchaeota archaeon]|nr:zinc ribbon domain-containing protein [Candidatus Micrarchaeota archaeon]
MKYCPECGKKLLKANLKFCPECGAALSAPKQAPAPEVARFEAPPPTTKVEVPAPEPVRAPPLKTGGGFIGKLLSFIVLLVIVIVIIGILFYVILPMFTPQKQLYVGVFMEGPVKGATVKVYALNDDGTKGELLAGPAYSDEDGEADFNLSKAPPYLLIESSGGSYQEVAGVGSEAENISVDLSGSDVLQAVVPSNVTALVVTPFTHMATALAMNSMKKHVPMERAVQFANNAVGQQYSIRSIVGLLPVAAYDSDKVVTYTYRERQYGLLLAGLVQEARDMKVRPIDLTQGLAQDWSDGSMDGTDDGSPIMLNDTSGKPVMLPPSAPAVLENLQKGIDKFIASPNDATHLQQFSISLKPVCADPNFYISVTTLPAWIDGESASFSLTVSGGNSPYAWSLKSGSALPDGFDLSSNGTLSGAGALSPGTTGSISPPFTVRVSDSSSPSKICEMEMRINIIEKGPELETRTVTCEVGSDCRQSVVSQVTGGTPPYYYAGYSSDNGEYPLDLTLWLDGTLRGKPSTAGTYVLEACVVDLVGWEDCKDVTIIVNEKPEPTCNKTCSAGQSQKAPPDCSCYAPAPPTPTCEPGHYSIYCGGQWRCCLNDWVCCGGTCSPPAFC